MQTEYGGYHFRDFTMGRLLADKARKNGDKTFLTFLPDGRKYSYSDIDRLSNAIANSLLANGIGKGSHVAMLMENSPEQVLTYFALGKIGAVVVPINTAARGDFLRYYIDQSDSTAIFADSGLIGYFFGLAEGTSVTQIYVLDTGEGTAAPACAVHDGRRVSDFARLLDGPTHAPEVEVAYNDMYGLMYTSGTTGASKGNIFNHIHMLTFGSGQIGPLGLCSDDIFHVWAPLFHVGAYGGSLMSSLLVDASIALTRRLSVRRFWDEVRESQSTAAMVLSIGDFIFNQPPSPNDRDHKLRFVLSTPVPPNFEDLEKRFGFRFAQGYGLSDFGLAFTHRMDDPIDKRTSIGRVMDGVQARVVDDDDVDVPVGEVGEIVLRKDGLPFAQAQGYYKMPQQTAQSTKNLWFHTGDRARRDADDYFYFVDRKKDAIRRRGENISAYEVELVVSKHDAVFEAAAYPANIGGGDEEVAVSVVLKEGGQVTEAELVAHCAANMPYYMVPRFIDFRVELPRTTTQKVQKYLLRQDVEEKQDTIWDREREGIELARR